MAIRNQLKRHSAKIVGYVDGFACSAASFILTACDEVKMYSNTMQMIHEALNYVFGNAKHLRKAADDLDQIMVGNRQAYLEKSGGKLNEEQLIKMLEEETWLTASECLALGLADEVIDSQIDMKQAQDMLEQRNKTLNQQINYSKKLVALMNELIQSPVPTQHIEEPAPLEPTPEPIQENKFINLISAILR
jgi:ATP-dependent Clp protease, protease subunit